MRQPRTTYLAGPYHFTAITNATDYLDTLLVLATAWSSPKVRRTSPSTMAQWIEYRTVRRAMEGR